MEQASVIHIGDQILASATTAARIRNNCDLLHNEIQQFKITPPTSLPDPSSSYDSQSKAEEQVVSTPAPVPESIPITNLEAGIIGWESQDDPKNPLSFRKRTKWVTVGLVAAFAITTTFATSISASSQQQIAREFFGVKSRDDRRSKLLLSLTVVIYYIGLAMGPLILAPLSEVYGRKPLLQLSNLSFIIGSLVCPESRSTTVFIIFRYIQGIGGSGCLAISSGIIGDMFGLGERGTAMALLFLGLLLGPVLSPIIDGYIIQDIGWRWKFWLCSIMAALITLATQFFVAESNPTVKIQRKARRLRKQLGRDDLRSCYQDNSVSPHFHPRIHALYVLQNLGRPFKMLIRAPVILLTAIVGSILYGLRYLLFVTAKPIFQQIYGFSPQATGLVYHLPMALGSVIGLVVCHLLSDRSVLRQTKTHNGIFFPEMRVPLSISGFCILPITFLLYGWCAEYKTHWILPALGLIPFSYGYNVVAVVISTFIIDCFPHYAASALASTWALGSLCAALLPLAGPGLYAKMGYGWGNTVIGFIALAMIPVPFILYKFGTHLRRNDVNLKL